MLKKALNIVAAPIYLLVLGFYLGLLVGSFWFPFMIGFEIAWRFFQ